MVIPFFKHVYYIDYIIYVTHDNKTRIIILLFSTYIDTYSAILYSHNSWHFLASSPGAMDSPLAGWPSPTQALVLA